MSKVVRLNEQDLVKLIKKILKEDVTKYTTPATVEEDMLMEFTVNAFNVTLSGVYMMMTGPDNKKYYVIGKRDTGLFGGPIYDRAARKVAYTDSDFPKINLNNYQKIAKQYGISISDATSTKVK
jgi:hypothetical protein